MPAGLALPPGLNADRAPYNANAEMSARGYRYDRFTGRWIPPATPIAAPAAAPSYPISPLSGGAGAGAPRDPGDLSSFLAGMPQPPGSVTEPMPTDDATEAAYGVAKRRVGEETDAAMRSLANRMIQRRIGGSGIEAAEMAKIAKAGLGELSDVSAGQAQAQSARNAALYDRNLSAKLAERGQNLGWMQSLLSLYGRL